MISLLLTLILVLVNPLCAYLDNGDVEIDTNSVYTFYETVGEYREIDFEGNPTIMKAYEGFPPPDGEENKWGKFIKSRALNSLSVSICDSKLPMHYIFSVARNVPDLLEYFGSQFNIFLVASLNHYFSPRVKGITSIVDHKYKYNDAMNSAIFLYPEIKYMVDRVVREDLLPASPSRTICTFAPPLSSTFLLVTLLSSIFTDSLTNPVAEENFTRIIVGTVGELHLGLAMDGDYSGIARVSSRSYSNVESILNSVTPGPESRTCDLTVVDGTILSGVGREEGLLGIQKITKEGGTLFVHIPGNTRGGDKVGTLLESTVGLNEKEVKRGARWQKQMLRVGERKVTSDTACTALEVFATAKDVSGDADFIERQKGDAWVLGVHHLPEVSKRDNLEDGEKGNKKAIHNRDNSRDLSIYYCACDAPSAPYATSLNVAEEIVHFAESTLKYAETVDDNMEPHQVQYDRIFWEESGREKSKMWMRYGRGVAISIVSLLVSSATMSIPPRISITILANIETQAYLAPVIPALVAAFPSLEVSYRILDITSAENTVNIFKPCAGGRLLIPHLAREDETSVIYFDADTLVLGKEAVEQLLDTAQDLMYANDKLVAAADEHGCESSSSWYGSGEKASINSGVLVLNLRKLADSSLPDQWIKRANDYYGHWGDQDVLNDSLRKDQVLDLPCNLNYRPDTCYFDFFDCQRCPLEDKKGGGLVLQGTRASNVPIVHAGTIYVPAWGELYWRFGSIFDMIVGGGGDGVAALKAAPPEALVTINSHLCKKLNGHIGRIIEDMINIASVK